MGQGPPGGSPPGLDEAKEIKDKHADRLLDKPGISGIGVGLKPNGKPVILIYKEKADVADIPEELEGVPVDSLVTGVIEPRAPTDRFPRPVPIGVSSGLSGVATGTLGVRVTDGTNVFALSNNHVYAGVNTASIGDPIIQPGDVDGGSDPADRIATLAAYQPIDFNGGDNTMDAAIALTSTANVGTATPADGYGAPSPITAPASIGLPVQKYGRTTGLQLGDVAATNVTVDVCYVVFFDTCLQEARFVQQISVSPGPFSAPGDSGSLIVTQGGNQPVALLFAGGDGLTIGSPIDLVLQRFGVTIEGTPPDGSPSAPTALSALAGHASATLSWTAPSFDGGSPVSGYKVYRGTSPNPTTAVATLGVQTSFLDSGLQNGTTYYYKVSALNANGESPLSNQAAATPAELVSPSEPLPSVDDFNRPNENPLSDGGRWTNGVHSSVETGHFTTSSQLACSKTTTCTAWRNAAQYGPDVEVWARLSVLPGANNQLRLMARLQQAGTTTYDGYMLRPNQLAGTDQILLERVDNGAIVNLLTVNQEFAAGDLFLLRVSGSTIEGWRHDGSAWSRLGTVSDSTYSAVGFTSIGLRGTTGRVDDFGARSLSQNPPGAPTGLAAAAGDGLVDLTWSAPVFDGGSPVTHYRIVRGTSPGAETFLALSTPTTYTDATAQNGTTYYYKVSALNANGESPLSNQAAATPAELVSPSEPLPSVDDFNRPNENPLSDAGRWTNGISATGGVETGLITTENTLACSKTTTCTAWRNAAQYGPDAESWARITTLPGTGNAVRLYARIQQPGSSAYDGYMLRANQLSGTDQVFVDRLDNGAFVNRLTVSQELAVSDVLLLRAKGSLLEAWRNDGTAWSRLGVVADSTYAAPGFSGIGIRGTAGRVDDFGARTLGGPPATAPTAPQNLQATPGNAQVALTWSAPASDGGSPLSSYTLYRGQSPNPTGVHASGLTSTSYTDASAGNGTTYYYRVTASNAVGESLYSNEVSATPSDFVLPVEPLVTLDTFNRANQNPLSFGGRWGNGILGASERSLKVVSNQLASDRNTTATAWWNQNTLGPSCEAYATMTTRPGNGNGVRLYVRLQSPGSAAVDGYMLLYTQTSGTDQAALYSITNGALTQLATASREIPAGAQLLLRADGTALEAWVREGPTWTRLSRVVDSTYTSAGYVGVGIRGKTGRLDDFGAR